MITRRVLLGGSVFGAAAPRGAVGTGAAGMDATGEQVVPLDSRIVRDIETRLEEIGTQLAFANGGTFTGTNAFGDKIRDAMTLFLRSSQKYPDFMEVGYLVFHAMYDWHIRNQVPLSVGRAADGRYGLVFMFTRLILRPDAVPDFIGLPYDQRA